MTGATAGMAAVLLAAGRATRYAASGGSEPTKLVAAFRGEPLVRHAARAALQAGLRNVVAVTGHAHALVEDALAGLEVRCVHNPDFAGGLATSLARGLAALPLEVPGAVILLADMPLVGAPVLRALIATAEADPMADAAVPVWRGERGNPVLLRRSLFEAAARLTGDEGARRLLRDPRLRVAEVPLGDAAVRVDVDGTADLAALQATPLPPVAP